MVYLWRPNVAKSGKLICTECASQAQDTPKIVFDWGSAPDPAGEGSLRHAPDSRTVVGCGKDRLPLSLPTFFGVWVNSTATFLHKSSTDSDSEDVNDGK